MAADFQHRRKTPQRQPLLQIWQRLVLGSYRQRSQAIFVTMELLGGVGRGLAVGVGMHFLLRSAFPTDCQHPTHSRTAQQLGRTEMGKVCLYASRPTQGWPSECLTTLQFDVPTTSTMDLGPS